MDCSSCATYKNTKAFGNSLCKKCRKYRDFQVRSTPRPPLIFENLSEVIKEACADQEKTRNILDHLCHIPPDMATMMLQYTVLRMSYRDIAHYNRRHISSPGSTAGVARKISKTAEIIRAMVHMGITD